MRLKHMEGDVKSKGMWFSKKLNNGDWDYWLVLEITNLEEMMGKECEKKYLYTLSAVSPEAAGQKSVDNAVESAGREDEDLNEETKAMLLVEYGIKATLYEETGSNYKTLMRHARKDMERISMMFSFHMDRQLNAIGNTGWEFIAGDI